MEILVRNRFSRSLMSHLGHQLIKSEETQKCQVVDGNVIRGVVHSFSKGIRVFDDSDNVLFLLAEVAVQLVELLYKKSTFWVNREGTTRQKRVARWASHSWNWNQYLNRRKRSPQVMVPSYTWLEYIW